MLAMHKEQGKYSWSPSSDQFKTMSKSRTTVPLDWEPKAEETQRPHPCSKQCAGAEVHQRL